MIAILDTSSLLSLSQYLLTLETNGILRDQFQDRITNGKALVIDAVFNESRYIKNGLIPNMMPVLEEKGVAKKTTNLLPNQSFIHELGNSYCVHAVKRRLSNEEFEVQKQ